MGGTTLGWLEHGTPANCEGYYGATELKGTIPAGVAVSTSYTWKQNDKGFARYKDGTGWHYHFNDVNWTDDSPLAGWCDVDPRHQNGEGGTNVREIFMEDAPGWPALRINQNNDAHIGAPDNWTDQEYDADFETWVVLNGYRISNTHSWEVIWTLDVQGGKWNVVGGTTP